MKTVEELLGIVSALLLENRSVELSFVSTDEYNNGDLLISSKGRNLRFHSTEVRVLGLVNALSRFERKGTVKVNSLGGMNWEIVIRGEK